MAEIERFLAYAADFEKTYVDDDWSRLERHFGEEAVYEVDDPTFGGRFVGPTAVLAAMRRSVDGFDRRCDARRIAVRRGPELVDGRIEVEWSVTYSKTGAPDVTLDGTSVVRFEGERIAHLEDRFPEGSAERVQAWVRDHAPGLSFSYA